jgi:hypothetical protein
VWTIVECPRRQCPQGCGRHLAWLRRLYKMGCAPAREWRQRGQRSSVQQAGLEKQEDASDSRGVLVGSQEAHLRDWPRNPNRRSSTCWVVRIALLGKPPVSVAAKKIPDEECFGIRGCCTWPCILRRIRARDLRGQFRRTTGISSTVRPGTWRLPYRAAQWAVKPKPGPFGG